MKLYKVLSVLANHGVSVFPPEDEPIESPVDLGITPWGQMFRQLTLYGFSEAQAGHALAAWVHYGKFDLNLPMWRVQIYVQRIVNDICGQPRPAPADWWIMVVAVAVVAAVALGLYVWAVLDQEYNLKFGTHDWAYLGTYKEKLWMMEILNVGTKQEGVYERGPLFWHYMASHDRNVGGRARRDWIWIEPGRMVLEGRRVVFYHVYQILGFYCYWCGLMTRFASRLYKLNRDRRPSSKPLFVQTTN
ncbi:hypothetical protein ES703_111674 [subsurface metagenome]